MMKINNILIVYLLFIQKFWTKTNIFLFQIDLNYSKQSMYIYNDDVAALFW